MYHDDLLCAAKMHFSIFLFSVFCKAKKKEAKNTASWHQANICVLFLMSYSSKFSEKL